MIVGHGIGGIRDLPVPTWLFQYGAAVVLVVSFVALASLWRRPIVEGGHEGRPLPGALGRILGSGTLRAVLGAVSFALFCVVAAAALFGSRSSSLNPAPTFVYVVFWLGLVPVTVLLGNVYAALNPWRAGADAAVRLAGGGEETRPYPVWLGRWPAAALLLAFAALELAYAHPAEPRSLGIAILAYSAVTWAGAAAFGREAWFRHGDGFGVYFGLLSRIAPLGTWESGGERRVVARPPFSELGIRDETPGTLGFVAVMLGAVAFDGFSQTSIWQDRIARLAESQHATLLQTGFNLVGLVATIVLFALAYLAATRAAEALSGLRDLTGAFLMSLVPIALAYAVAHYFTLLLIQGQFAIPLASDPFGRGWDLFGTAGYRPDATLLSPNAVWYVQVGALVLGHVAGLVLAHDRALALSQDARTALRTQYPLLALMVLYTVGGLWLLSQG